MPLCLRQTPSWVERNRVPMDIVIGQAQRHRWSSGRGAFPPGAGPADLRLLGTKAGQTYGSEAFSQILKEMEEIRTAAQARVVAARPGRSDSVAEGAWDPKAAKGTECSDTLDYAPRAQFRLSLSSTTGPL